MNYMNSKEVIKSKEVTQDRYKDIIDKQRRGIWKELTDKIHSF